MYDRNISNGDFHESRLDEKRSERSLCDAKQGPASKKPTPKGKGFNHQTQKFDRGHDPQKSINQQNCIYGRNGFNKKNKDSNAIEHEISNLRERNHSYR